LQTASSSVDKVTVHQYDLNGRTATLNDFTNPDTLNGLVNQLQQIIDVRAQWAPGKPIWLGETASAFGGGAKGLSDSYVDGFPWLDKLGTAAKMGIDIVVRQTFLEASYALIDSDFNPLPDYWLTLLYKRLVGGKVLNTTLHQCKGDNCTLYDRSKVRIYAHCAKNKYGYFTTPASYSLHSHVLSILQIS
ncbi:heparanase-like, partial [Ciona intestinalis]